MDIQTASKEETEKEVTKPLILDNIGTNIAKVERHTYISEVCQLLNDGNSQGLNAAILRNEHGNCDSLA